MDDEPTLGPGLTLLSTPDARSTALHDLVARTLGSDAGHAYWVDARNAATTYALAAVAPTDRLLDRVRVARAFTAYQHHELVRTLVRRVDARTGLVVCPNLGALYRDDDVPEGEAADLLDATVAVLADLARSRSVPVLATATSEARDRLASVADGELDCTRTRFGFRYDGEDFETTVYPVADGWQTTIPYWVDRCGAVVDRSVVAAVDPAEPTVAEFALGV
ncbi:hypothetical protein [Haloarchaeobius sp. HRN-SO-5]|uniref:hypothetical protein n=1 Tax=Haloarchaeobius sp. HRN-SO-5 TaxID=3446118 RepID=UPI003EBA7A76